MKTKIKSNLLDYFQNNIFWNNFLLIVLAIFFILNRYSSAWISLVILIPFFLLVEKNKRWWSFLLAGITIGFFSLLIELNFLIKISRSIYIISVLTWTIFLFLPFLVMLYWSKKYYPKYIWFLYPTVTTISIWLYNFTPFHLFILSPIDGLVNTPFFLQTLDLAGEYFLIFIIAVINFLLFQIIKNFRDRKVVIRDLWIIIFIVFVVSIYGYWNIKENNNMNGREINVLLIQPNIIESTDKRNSSYQKFIKRYSQKNNVFLVPNRQNYETLKMLSITKQALKLGKVKPDLIIWPEKIDYQPMFQEDSRGNFVMIKSEWVRSIIKFENKYKIPILIQGSAQSFYDRNKEYNLVTLINKNSPQRFQLNQFHIKQKLFIFGERVPFFINTDFFKKLREKQRWFKSDITKGNKQQNIILNNKYKIGVNICFENGFSEIAREQKMAGADFIVNVSNDSSFQSKKELRYQETSSVFRAIENRINYIRSTNVGLTEIINPQGVIISKIKPFTENYLYNTIKISSQNNLTLFDKYGYLFVYILAMVYLLFVFKALWRCLIYKFCCG